MGVDADLAEIPDLLEKLAAELDAGTIGLRDYEFNKQVLERRLDRAEQAARERARARQTDDTKGVDPKTLAEGVPRW